MTASPSRGARVFTAFAVGILLVQAAWILALPTFRGIDEFDHVYKAAAVARGQWTSSGQAAHGRGGLVRIPGDIVSAASAVCRSYDYTRPDDCVPVRRYDNGDVQISSAASAYNPAYYLVVGTLARPFHGDQLDYVIRGITALTCALLLAWAATMVASWGRTRWPLAFFTLGLTPVLVYSTAIASPNGIAYSGAALLWVSLLTLVHRGAGRTNEAAAATVGAVALLTAHGTGPMLAFLILVLAACLKRVGWWWQVLTAQRRVWLTAAATILLVALSSVAWIAYARPGTIGEPVSDPLTTGDQIAFQAVWLLEAIAVFPTVTEYPPTVVYALWGLPLLGLFVFLLRSARGRARAVVAGTLVLLITIPAVFTVATYADTGLAWQGRYSLPLWLGVSGLAALFAASRREALPKLVPTVYVMAALAATISVVHVGRQELASGATEPAVGHVPGGLVLLGTLTTLGVLVPLLLPRRWLGGESDAEPPVDRADPTAVAR